MQYKRYDHCGISLAPGVQYLFTKEVLVEKIKVNKVGEVKNQESRTNVANNIAQNILTELKIMHKLLRQSNNCKI